jgi:multiple sugar transport system substrate-binding protein
MNKIIIKRSISIFIVIAYIIIQTTGCGSQTKPKAAASTKDVKHLVMWKFKSNKEDYAIYDWVRQWNESNPGVQVDFELIPYNDYLANKLPTAFATNSAPDIYMISAGGFLKYAKAGCMLSLDSYISSDLKKDFYEQSLNVAIYDGKIMGIPIEREPVALFYNKKVFSERNLPAPKDWDEFTKSTAILDSKKMAGTYIPTLANDYQNFIFYSFLSQAGGAINNKTNTSLFASSGAKALKLWRNLSKYNYSMETTIQSPSDIYPLATEKAATQVCGYWAVNALKKYYPSFDFGIVPLPYPQGGINTSVYGGWFQAVNPSSRYANEAAKFTLWMWGEDNSRPLEWCTDASTKFPARKSVIESNPSTFNTAESELFEKRILPNAVPEPRYPVELSNIVSKAIQDTMFTDKNVEDIAKTTDDSINNYLKTNGKVY